jgi:hypothetical protein
MGNLLNPGEIHSDQKNVEVHFAKKSKKSDEKHDCY